MSLFQSVAIATTGTPDWLLRIVSGAGLGVGAWALLRSVKHGEQLQHLTTFTGADGKNGMAEKIQGISDDVGEKFDDLAKNMHSMRNAMQSMAINIATLTAKLEERK